MNQQTKHLYEFGAFCLDARDHLLLLNERIIPLTPKAVETLLFLVQNAGRVVSKDELMLAIWPDTFVEESGLTRNISVLRKALGESDDGLRFIETIPKRGYRFVAEVKEEQVAFGGSVDAASPQVRPGPAATQVTTSTAVAVREAPPDITPEASLEKVEPKSPRRGTRPARLWMFLVCSAVLVASAFEVLRITLPPPLPRVVKSVMLVRFGAVEGGEPFAVAGHTLYFAGRRGTNLFPMQVSTEGGEVVPVRTPFQSAAVLTVSPDASKLLLASFSGVEQDQPFWLLPALGGSPKRLADLTGHVAAWLPGGNKILFAKGNDLLVANSDGTEPRKLLSAPGAPEWLALSPDGRTLRFTSAVPGRELYSLWEASADGSNLHPMFPGWKPSPTLWGEGECCGTWTPDGKYYLFRSIRASGASLWATREKGDWLHAANHQPVEIYASHGGLGNPFPSPDGRRLFVASARHDRELARYVSSNHQFVPYLSGIPARWLDYSRDGQWIAYADGLDGTLWRMAADGTQRLQLTHSPPVTVYPRWSPDGKRILLHMMDPGVYRKLYVISSEGGKLEKLLPGASEEEQADWFPDGNSILFDRHETTENGKVSYKLCILNLTTKQASVLPGSEGLKFSALSPDGRYVAASTIDAHRIMLFDFRGRSWAELASGVGLLGATWTRDSKYVYFQDQYAGVDQPVFRVRIADRKVERVTAPNLNLSEDVTGFVLVGLTPDGSPLVSMGRTNSDIYALDLDLP